jgi:hypothetical protein
MYISLDLFLTDFNKTLHFSAECRKMLKYHVSWKSAQWEPSFSMRTKRTDRHDEAKSRFRNFAKATKNSTQYLMENLAVLDCFIQTRVWQILSENSGVGWGDLAGTKKRTLINWRNKTDFILLLTGLLQSGIFIVSALTFSLQTSSYYPVQRSRLNVAFCCKN